MLFTSFHFFIFLPLILSIYYLLPHTSRWILLLLASMIFYSVFSPAFLLFFMVLILINYWLGKNIYSDQGLFNKRYYFSGLIINLMVLCFFKYFDYLEMDMLRIARLLDLRYPSPMIRVILPLGLSFLIFTLIAYLVDIKRKRIPAEQHPGILATYFLFFPKITQGPIERGERLIPQFYTIHPFDYARFTGGLKRMAWGFFKKLVISDTLALYVNAVFTDSSHINGPYLILGIILFAFQIYADFSGYTDIALGTASLFGFKLTENFKRPYLADSIKEFWNRWHISFSTWLRDYIFLPLAYWFSARMKKERYAGLSTEKWIYFFSIMITFYICGLWHGNGLKFQVWGLLFGLFLTFSNWMQKPFREIRKRFHIRKTAVGYKKFRILMTFTLLCLTWIFFRADDLYQARDILSHLFHGWTFSGLTVSWDILLHHGINERIMGIMAISTGILVLTDILSEKKDIFQRLGEHSILIRWSIYYLLILVIIVYSAGGNRQFIYLQF